MLPFLYHQDNTQRGWPERVELEGVVGIRPHGGRPCSRTLPRLPLPHGSRNRAAQLFSRAGHAFGAEGSRQGWWWRVWLVHLKYCQDFFFVVGGVTEWRSRLKREFVERILGPESATPHAPLIACFDSARARVLWSAAYAVCVCGWGGGGVAMCCCENITE